MKFSEKTAKLTEALLQGDNGGLEHKINESSKAQEASRITETIRIQDPRSADGARARNSRSIEAARFSDSKSLEASRLAEQRGLDTDTSHDPTKIQDSKDSRLQEYRSGDASKLQDPTRFQDPKGADQRNTEAVRYQQELKGVQKGKSETKGIEAVRHQEVQSADRSRADSEGGGTNSNDSSR